MKGKWININKLHQEPYGSVIMFRKKLYWYSKGLDAPILTDKNGRWSFITDFWSRTKARNIFVVDIS